jgi:hypothetical protein
MHVKTMMNIPGEPESGKAIDHLTVFDPK